MIAGLGHFTLYDFGHDAVVGPVAVAVDDADLCTGFKRCAELFHERDGMGEFMIGLEDQYGVDA